HFKEIVSSFSRDLKAYDFEITDVAFIILQDKMELEIEKEDLDLNLAEIIMPMNALLHASQNILKQPNSLTLIPWEKMNSMVSKNENMFLFYLFLNVYVLAVALTFSRFLFGQRVSLPSQWKISILFNGLNLNL
ncbi:hypothetical protein ACJX0J_007875, partial [Zea mays]